MTVTDAFNGALRFDQTVLLHACSAPDAIRRGMLVVLLVGLVVGGVNGVRTFFDQLDPAQLAARQAEQLEQVVTNQALAATTDEQRDAARLLQTNLEPTIEIIRAVNALPAILPRPLAAFLRGLGVLASQPLIYLGTTLLWIIFTHIAASRLGGTGTFLQMLGPGLLSVAPQTLDALAFIPLLGPALELAATVWSIAILIGAAGVAHRLEPSRAIMAVLLFPLIGAVVALLFACLLYLIGGLV